LARFSDSFINRVAQANDIVEVVGQFVALKKRGKDFVGLCPFHDDNRPSMYVSPAKQIFKCFACGAGGGVFQFLMQHQKMTFPESVRQMAERAGIPMPVDDSPAGADRSLSGEALTKLTGFARQYFSRLLWSEAGAEALQYARGRKLTDESIRRFGLGYAADAWEALRAAARKAGHTDRQLVAAGLAIQREDGSCYDRFRHRLMFPIIGPSEKVIAFGGRALAADERAKYLNSPETDLFDKSANLYGLNWSRQAIVRAKQAVVVEGYLDALMCLQEGVPNVVATLGTALTDRHVRMLSRFAEDVVLVFDADTAGEAAAERAIELFLSQRVHVRVAAVPADDQVKDPCDYVLAAGAEAFDRLLKGAPDALEYAWSRRRDAYLQAGTLARKASILEEFLQLIVSSSAYGAIDTLRQGLLIGHLSELVGLPPADVAGQMQRVARRIRRRRADPDAQAAPGTYASQADRAESWVLGALLTDPELFARVEGQIDPGAFHDPVLRLLAEHVWRLAGQGRLEVGALLGADRTAQYGGVITDLQVSAENRGNVEQTLTDAVQVLMRRSRREELARLKGGQDADLAALMQKLSDEGRRPDARRHPRLR
jgi:DNA primase